MDIPCPRCGEPWDFDTLHEEASESGRTFDKVYADFCKNGCATFSWADQCDTDSDAGIRYELADLLGDDVDGYASLMDDFGF